MIKDSKNIKTNFLFKVLIKKLIFYIITNWKVELMMFRLVKQKNNFGKNVLDY